jgi:hypothetical protein
MIVKIGWGVTAFAAGISALTFVATVGDANGAPQQAAGSAMALAIAVIPYVFTRCLEGITQKG